MGGLGKWSPELPSKFNYSVVLWLWGKETPILSYTFWKTKIWFLLHMFIMFVFFRHLKSERKQNYDMFHVDHQNVSHPNNMLYCTFTKHDILILLNFSVHLHSDENFSGNSMSHAMFLFNIFLYKNFQLEIVQPVLKAWFRPLIFKVNFLACQWSLWVFVPSKSWHITNI